jgi:molybdenum cofactor guanylyltransferase
LQLVGGRRIIDRVAQPLRTVSDRLLVVSSHPDAAAWLPGAMVGGDVLPGRASLVGIHAALVHAGSDVVVIAWDMPFVPGALLASLRDRLRAGVSAVIPMGIGGPEPACAAYSVDALAHIERLVRAHTLKLANLVDALPNVVLLSAAEVARFGDPAVMFMNVNSPEDLARAEGIASAL